MIDLLVGTFVILTLTMIIFLKIEWFIFTNLLFLMISSIINNPDILSVNILGIQLYTQDLFFLSQMICIVFYVVKMIFLKDALIQSPYFKTSFLLFILIVLKVLFAFPTQGTVAFLEGKHFLYFFGNILFFSVAKLSNQRLKSILKIILFFAVCYLSFALLRYFEFLPHLYEGLDMGWEGTFNEARLLNRSDLMYPMIGSIISLVVIFSNFYKKEDVYLSIYILLFFLFSTLILFSETRSIILCFIMSMVGFLFLNKLISIRLVLMLSVILLPIFILASLFDISFLSKYFTAFSYQNLFGQNSTLVFRNVVSLVYLQYMTVESYFFGMTLADAPIVFQNLYFEPTGGKVGLHNFFVECIYYFGIPIFIVLLYLYFTVLKKLSLMKKNNDNIIIINTLILSNIAYFFLYLAWSPDVLNGILMGISINLIANNELGNQG